jgi:simple sugar transport system ATP-binding protein
VISVSSKVTVLRKGKVVSTLPTNRTSKKELAKMMVGREVLFRLGKKPVEKGEIVLEIREIKALSDKGILALKGVSFEVCKGEILGIAGVAGNGQSELAEVITGLRKVVEGKVYINNNNVTNLNTNQIISEGVSHIPEDKIKMGLVPNLNLAENLILKNYNKKPFSNRFFIDESYVNSHTDKLIEEFDIDTPDRYIPVKLLSGGNLQKLLLAREISEKPNLIIAVHPTRGLDVGATEFIRNLILKQREEGAAILLISEDLEEILSLSDRIAVIFEGKITGIVRSEEAKLDDIGLMMAGVKKTDLI